MKTHFSLSLVPSQPRQLRVDNQSPNTVNLQWERPEVAGEISSYIIYYREDGNAPQMTAEVNPPVQYHTVNDLSEGTRYVMEVAARSNNGEGPKSIPQEVRTIDFSKLSQNKKILRILISSGIHILAPCRRHKKSNL